MSSAELLRFLAAEFTEPIRDPLWGNIFLSPALERLASSPPFAKLGRIKQLGPAYLVYPGATHTRRAHSIGVFHMARRLAWALAARGHLDFCSREGLQSYLVAALCHDLGHFPFAHSLKELPLERHEVLTAAELLAEPIRSLALEAGADPEAAAAIVDDARPDHGDREIRFFRGLLSGVLDPDKLDYLNRDAFFCGVPYGLQDSDFILQRVALGPGDALAVDERGLMSVEGLLFAKYLMYRSVYWHKGVRSATAMIKKAVLLALNEGILASGELYGLDDDGFYAKLRSSAFPPFAFAKEVFEGRVYGAVLDLPFDETDERHRRLLDLGSRLGAEEGLAADAGLARLDLVIDVPEGVSFETDLPVLVERSSYELRSTAELRSAREERMGSSYELRSTAELRSAREESMGSSYELRSTAELRSAREERMGSSYELRSTAELRSAREERERAFRETSRLAVSFADSPTVFSPPVVAGFARSLRRLRVFARVVSPREEARLKSAALDMLG